VVGGATAFGLRIWNLSPGGIDPFNDSDPAEVGMSTVLKLSLTISGTQWTGPLKPDR
jgi:hypothetical protein